MEASETVKLKITNVSGTKSYEICAYPHTTIREVIDKLYDQFGLDCGRRHSEIINIKICGMPLENDRTLADYGIQTGASIQYNTTVMRL